jgi:hypothetical protein
MSFFQNVSYRKGSIFFFGSVLAGVLALGIGAGTVAALEIRTRDTSISEEEYIDDDLFLFGDEITVDGTVTGDLVASGDRVTITGTVGGNVYVSGGEVLISGEIGRSLYAAGGRVKISGEVERSIYTAGGMVLISSDARIDEDLLAAGGQLDIGGIIGDDVWAAGGNVDSQARVEGDFIVSGGVIRADEDDVAGDYKVNQGRTGAGWIWEEDGSDEVQKAVKGSVITTAFLRIMWFLGSVLVGVILIWLLPVKTSDIVDKIGLDMGEFVWSLLVGLLVTAAAPLAIILLVATVLGAPVAFLFVGLLVFLLVFGSLWFDMAIGSRILEAFGYTDSRLFASLLVGKAIRALIILIPCIGALYSLITAWVVVGAAVRMKLEKVQESRGATKSMKESLMPKDMKMPKKTKKRVKKK